MQQINYVMKFFLFAWKKHGLGLSFACGGWGNSEDKAESPGTVEGHWSQSQEKSWVLLQDVRKSPNLIFSVNNYKMGVFWLWFSSPLGLHRLSSKSSTHWAKRSLSECCVCRWLYCPLVLFIHFSPLSFSALTHTYVFPSSQKGSGQLFLAFIQYNSRHINLSRKSWGRLT